MLTRQMIMSESETVESLIRDSFLPLKEFCEKENFKGWDPYDGLNARFFRASPLSRSAFARECWIQFFKRSPINFRRAAQVEKQWNPKGLGLFLTGYCNLHAIEPSEEYLDRIHFLARTLLDLRSKGYSRACWGYNFDWQSLVFFQEKYAPTVVATAFVAYSLMDAYECTGNQEYLDVAVSAAEFVITDLNRSSRDEGFIFSYSPKDNTCIYNASLLGARLLSRVYGYTRDASLVDLARQSVVACVHEQLDSGAWYQGEEVNQKWSDSFHTGYNLEGVAEYSRYSGDLSFEKCLARGLNYLIQNYFLTDGTPKYFDGKVYPIDIHCPAQFVVTLYRLNRFAQYRELVDKVLVWTIRNMQDPAGFFYYQRKKRYTIKIPYMRWAQAWMFYGMSFYFLALKMRITDRNPPVQECPTNG